MYKNSVIKYKLFAGCMGDIVGMGKNLAYGTEIWSDHWVVIRNRTLWNFPCDAFRWGRCPSVQFESVIRLPFPAPDLPVQPDSEVSDTQGA